MTRAERLRAACDERDEAAIRSLLADLPESERADLQAEARTFVAAVMRGGINEVGHLGPMLLVAYGTLPATDLRRLGWRSNHLPPDVAVVLRRRDPERLRPIVDHLLDDVGGGAAWRVVRSLVRDGAVPRPDRPSYTIGMLAATRYGSAADLVTADPGLIEVEIWRLFEVEGGGEDSLANHEKFFDDTWGRLFRDLAARDPATRDRLLDLSLDALGRDFATYRAGWFSRFHDRLEPTDGELASRARAYLGLLRSQVGPTVSMAVSALTRIDQAGRLDPDDLLDRVGAVLVEGSAGTAKAALRLVASAGRGSPVLARRAAITATDALAHPAPEVQRQAIATIGRLAGGPDREVAEAVGARMPDVAASQRAAAEELATRLGSVAAPAVPGGRDLAAATTIASPAPPPPPASPIDPDRAIQPLATPEALVDLAVSVLEAGEPPDDIERVLEGVARLSTVRSAEVARLTSPVARRARVILARRERLPFTGLDARADVAAVLLAWTDGSVADTGAVHPSAGPSAGVFLSARAREVAEAAAARRPYPTLALPTHAGGWIDPAALVARLEAGAPASRLDLVAAILRLAPAGRERALAHARALWGEAGAAVRYALGGDEPVGPTAAWWVAAARVRAPGVDDVAVERRHPRLGPGAGRAGFVRLRPPPPGSWHGLALDLDPELPAHVDVALPTVLMFEPPSSFSWSGRSEPAMLRWMATIHPADREAWSASGSVVLGRNVDWWSAEWANRAFLEPFLDPSAPIGSTSRAMLGIALGAKEAGERGLASDVVRLAFGDGRLAPADLAAGLAAAAAVGCDRPSRWAVSLADVAAASGRHAEAVAAALGEALPAIAGRPTAGLVPVLRLLDELLAGTGGRVPAATSPVLDALAEGGGQAGRLARSLRVRGVDVGIS